MKSNKGEKQVHVRCLDIHIFRHPLIQKNLAKGLGHIASRPTKIHTAIKALNIFWDLLKNRVNLPENYEAKNFFISLCEQEMKQGFYKHSRVYEFWLDSKSVRNEIDWIQSKLLISRSDKGANMPVFDCIQ